MIKTILSVLQENGALALDSKPIMVREYYSIEPCAIIEVAQERKEGNDDFIVYPNASSPEGIVLVQHDGKIYRGMVKESDLYVTSQNIIGNLPFAVLGRYPCDYYFARLDFVKSLEELFEE
jgi:hypothetical protein